MTTEDQIAPGGWYSDEAATFGDRLAAAREALGMDQKALAGRLGVKLSTIERWENDQSEPRANKLVILAGVLNVPMPWLLTGDGDGLDAPGDDQALPADLQSLMTELKIVQAALTRTANRLGHVEKRLKAVLKETS